MFQWFYNEEGEEQGYQYVINVEELDKEIYSVDKLIEELEVAFGEVNIDEPQDDMYIVWLDCEEDSEMLECICQKYEEIFEEESSNLEDDYEDDYEEDYE